MLLSGGVEEGRCANHKCTRTATAQGSRMSASLRMDGALHSAGAAFSFSGVKPLPEPHGTARWCEPLRVCASFQLRSSPPSSHHCLMSASAARRDGPMGGEEPRRGVLWEMEFSCRPEQYRTIFDAIKYLLGYNQPQHTMYYYYYYYYTISCVFFKFSLVYSVL